MGSEGIAGASEMTCLTCDHYEPMPYRADRVTSLCMNGAVRERYVDAAYRECQGRLHSGRVGFGQRLLGIRPIASPEFDFDGGREAGLWR